MILICKSKSDPNARDKAGNTPLHKAASKTKNPEIVRLLLACGADRWLKNGKEQLPFDLAKQNKKLQGTEVYWRLHEATYSPRSSKCCGRSYPSSDGKPMAESDSKRIPLTYAVDRLRYHFRNRADVYASGNLLIYYEEGNPRASVAPDVVRGVRRAQRRTLVVPAVGGVEGARLRAWRSRRGRRGGKIRPGKRELYRRLGVREYWQYDPTRDYLKPPLQGLELVGEDYERLPGRELADGTLALRSEVLGLELASGRPAAAVPRSADRRGPAGLGGGRRPTP